MRKLWLRLRRLLRQSEIRLAAGPLRLNDARPGDRLQIGPRLWRVERTSLAGAHLELEAEVGASRARLRLSTDESEPSWILDDGEAPVHVAPAEVLHFGLDQQV